MDRILSLENTGIIQFISPKHKLKRNLFSFSFSCAGIELKR